MEEKTFPATIFPRFFRARKIHKKPCPFCKKKIEPLQEIARINIEAKIRPLAKILTRKFSFIKDFVGKTCVIHYACFNKLLASFPKPDRNKKETSEEPETEELITERDAYGCACGCPCTPCKKDGECCPCHA